MSAPYPTGVKSGAGAGGRVVPNSTILDKPLSKGKAEINVSTFALLFSEMVQVWQLQIDSLGPRAVEQVSMPKYLQMSSNYKV